MRSDSRTRNLNEEHDATITEAVQRTGLQKADWNGISNPQIWMSNKNQSTSENGSTTAVSTGNEAVAQNNIVTYKNYLSHSGLQYCCWIIMRSATG